MIEGRSQKIIPEYVRNLFWDVKKEDIDIKKHSSFIIKRVLDYGNAVSLKWLFKTYPEDLIKEVIHNKRGLHPKTINFWEKHYENI